MHPADALEASARAKTHQQLSRVFCSHVLRAEPPQAVYRQRACTLRPEERNTALVQLHDRLGGRRLRHILGSERMDTYKWLVAFCRRGNFMLCWGILCRWDYYSKWVTLNDIL